MGDDCIACRYDGFGAGIGRIRFYISSPSSSGDIIFESEDTEEEEIVLIDSDVDDQ